MRRFLAGVLILAAALSGCAKQADYARKQIFAMDTVMELQVWGDGAEAAVAQAESTIMELEEQWSATKAGSVADRLNQGQAISEAEQAVVDEILALWERTAGAFCPRLHALTALWGFPDKNFRVPAAWEIEEAREKEEWDFGGAIKGYTGQVLAEQLSAMGMTRGILNLGGNVQTFGAKPDGSPWQVGIQNPYGDGYLAVLQVEGTASVVTSGSYQRYFEQDGVVYHHILDPETGYPADSGLVSVTVVCRDGLKADGLSTALFVLGVEKGAAFWRESDDFEAVFIGTDGTISATAGAALTGCEFEVISR